MQQESAKVVLLGDSGVGKTSLVSMFVDGKMPETAKPTVGAAFITKLITVDNYSIELRIWDTAGQEVYRGLAPMYYRSANIAIIVYDVGSNSSFESVKYWVNELKKNLKGNASLLICGNKIDLDEERVVDATEAKKFAEQNGAIYTEVSALQGTGVDQAFRIASSNYLSQIHNERVGFVPNQVNLDEKKDKSGCLC